MTTNASTVKIIEFLTVSYLPVNSENTCFRKYLILADFISAGEYGIIRASGRTWFYRTLFACSLIFSSSSFIITTTF